MTTYFNERTGEEELDSKQIIFHYLKGQFWIDVISSFPVSLILLTVSGLAINSKLLKFLGVMKLTRIMRLSKIISYSHLKSDSKSFMNFVKLFFFLAIYLHLQASIWFIIAKDDEKWIPPLDTIGNTTDLYEQTTIYQYLMSIYYSVLIFCPNDLLPQNMIELLFTIFALILAHW